MIERKNLRPGAFYWVIPTNDPDAHEEWERNEQPARFRGWNDEGSELWDCLNCEHGDDWGVKWVGPEIVLNSRQKNAKTTIGLREAAEIAIQVAAEDAVAPNFEQGLRTMAILTAKDIAARILTRVKAIENGEH